MRVSPVFFKTKTTKKPGAVTCTGLFLNNLFRD